MHTIADLGQPSYRATQVYRALTRGSRDRLRSDRVLPRDLRATLAERLQPLSLAPVETRVAPTGDARKTLFQTADGHAVEAVLMIYPQTRHGLRVEPGRLLGGLRVLRVGRAAASRAA